MAKLFSLNPTWLVIFIFPIILATSNSSFALDRVSLKKYPELSIPVPNPMETSKLPARKTFQVNHEEFILQFFFNGRDIFGYILKNKGTTFFLKADCKVLLSRINKISKGPLLN